MLLTVLAPPSRFAAWALSAIRSLAEAALGELDYIRVTTMDQFRLDWHQRKTKNVMLFADFPDVDLARVLAKNKGPTIFLHEDPVAVAIHCIAFSAQTPISAARMVSASFSTLHDIALACPSLIILSRDQPPDALLRRAAEFFSLPVDDEQIAGILANVPFPAEIPARPSATSAANAFTVLPLSDDLVCSLAPFASIYDGSAVKSFIWPRSLFLGVDQLGAPTDISLADEIKLTGPARILFYGPYFHLPTGEWILAAQFRVFENSSGNQLNIEVMAGLNVVVQRRTRLPARGSYEFKLSFAVTEPRDPIQLRIAIMEGAIEGILILDQVTISRPEPVAADLSPAVSTPPLLDKATARALQTTAP